MGYTGLGNTIPIHAQTLFYLWGPVINLAIVFALYSYRRYAVIIHIAVGVIVGLFTLITSFNITATVGFPPRSEYSLFIHTCVGTAACGVLIVLMFLGIYLRFLNMYNFSSKLIGKIRRSHQVLGYLTILLAKIAFYINLWNYPDLAYFWGILGSDIFFLLVIILRKTLFPQLQHIPSSQIIKNMDLPKIQSLSQLPSKNHIIFNNLIYDLSQLGSFHPMGQEVIRSVANRDVDRFLYGMYSSEKLPGIQPHSHSYRCLTLLGDPVAELSISPTCPNIFFQKEFKVVVSRFVSLSSTGDLYELSLKCLEGTVEFLGYENMRQLGRFRSLNLNGKVTRLYTNVYFTLRSNTTLMEDIFPGELSYLRERVIHKLMMDDRITNVMMDDYSSRPSLLRQDCNIIPLVLKQYQQGALARQVIDNMLNKRKMSLVLSYQKGLGLELGELQPGRVILVAGGTGLLPFCDFIDLFFKREYMKANPLYRKRFLEISPILAHPFLEETSFEVYGSFRNIQDIHRLTLLQLAYLQKHSQMLKVTLKLGIPLPEDIQSSLGFSFTQSRFEKSLKVLLSQEGASIAKVWVCGPPKMNENMSQLMEECGCLQKLLIL